MKSDLEQDISKWSDWGGNVTPISEIRAWNYYGGRQWISKYIPRYVKVIKAGCSVGTYVFYLGRLGIDIAGLDFAKSLIDNLNNQKQFIEPNIEYLTGNVTDLPFKDNSLNSYISLSVIEHFFDGPHLALEEAYRVLRPGGVANLTTPNFSFSRYYSRPRRKLKDSVTKILKHSQ